LAAVLGGFAADEVIDQGPFKGKIRHSQRIIHETATFQFVIHWRKSEIYHRFTDWSAERRYGKRVLEKIANAVIHNSFTERII
jgi:hypothetical protein